jgi:hypothetical protein
MSHLRDPDLLRSAAHLDDASDHGHKDGPDDDHHHHEHDHLDGWWDRLRHTVSELTGGHSHDAADQIDDALEANRAGRRALLISLAGLGSRQSFKRSSLWCRGRSRS